MNTVLKHWFGRPMAKQTDVTDMQELARILLIVPNSSNFLQRIKFQKFQSNMRLNLENKNFCWSFYKQKKKLNPTFSLSGCKSAVIMLNVVVFPARFGFKVPKISPLSTIILMLFTTICFLNDFFKPWNSSWDFLHLTQSATKLLNKWLYLTHALYKHGYNMTYIWV